MGGAPPPLQRLERSASPCLEEFLAGRPDWPTEDEFDAAGRTTLRRALNRFGCQERWADELGLDLPRHRRRRPAWTDERVEAQLRQLTAGSDLLAAQAGIRAGRTW